MAAAALDQKDLITRKIKDKFCEILDQKENARNEQIKNEIAANYNLFFDNANIVKQSHMNITFKRRVEKKREDEESEFEPENNAKITKVYETLTHQVPKHLIRTLKPLPRMCVWTPIQRNIFVEEEYTLHHVPYMGDSVGDEFITDLVESYDGKVHAARDSDLTDDVICDLVDYLTTDAPSSEHEGNIKLRKNRRYTEPLKFDLNSAFSHISEAFPSKGKPSKIKSRYDSYKLRENEQIFKETIPNIDCEGDLDQVYSKEKALHTYKTLFCRMCLMYDCPSHSHIVPGDMPYPQSKEDLSIQEICGKDCFLNIENVRIEDYLKSKIQQDKKNDYPKLKLEEINTDHWTNRQKTFFNVFIDCHMGNYCRTAKCFKPGEATCAQVYVYAQQFGRENIEKFKSAEQVEYVKRLKKKDNKSKQSNSQNSQVRKIHNELFKSNSLKQYKACDHVGTPCTEENNCICIINGTTCEKFCVCPADCCRRFTGCKCKNSCMKNCPCQMAARECDPDLCGDCGASQPGEMSKMKNIRCRNIMIQRFMGRHLLLGRSDVAGWGVFLNGIAEENDFISEYCGEIITQLEADRRGKVYDKDCCSFLFNLNDDYVIDAKYKGNKIRFANHSINPNCSAKVLLVNGEHRIGIFAKRKIKHEEELFFDYRYGPKEQLKFVSIERET